MKSQLQVIGLILLTACNFLLFYRIVKSSSNSFPLLRSYLRANDTSYDLNGNPNNPPAVEEDSTKTGKLVPNGMPKRTIEAKDLSECDRCKLDLPPVLTDKWMTISMPKKSYFRFDAPMDELKWKQAACSAACGEQVLLKKIMKLFPTGKEFLNGETSFRQWQHLINIFMNKITSFQPLLHDKSKFNPLPAEEQVVTSEQAKYIKELLPPPDSIYKETDQFYPVLTAGFPFIKLGSTSYSDSYFQGRESFGGYYISLEKFISMWRANKDNIRTPFVVMYVNNENWGWLSTFFPNRTAPWGFDEDGLQQNVYEFLDHPMTVGLITNQHHNYSHPKIIPLPLGLAGNDKVKAALYTAMQRSVLNTTKHNLLLSSSSNWGPRPGIIQCVKGHMDPGDIKTDLHTTSDSKNHKETKKTPSQYYGILSENYYVLGVAGLGYDCFRNWEVLTIGSMLVTERGVGLDRLYWRLPVLLVDDFHDITSEMLRTAYIEAIYNVDMFLFEKLTQPFWENVIRSLSYATIPESTKMVEKYFSMQAEDIDFGRPKVLNYGTKESEAYSQLVNKCKRLDQQSKMGKCKKFPAKTC